MFSKNNHSNSSKICINFSEVPFQGYLGDPEICCSPARTLSPDYLGYHKNGWEIQGEVREDYFEWVNHFRAINHKTGEWVSGDFERRVYASSYKTLIEFMTLFPYEEWDYYDI